MKGVNENIDEVVLIYVGVCIGSHSVSRLQKRWIDTLK